MRDDSKPHLVRNRRGLVVVYDSRAQDIASPAQLKAGATVFNPDIVEVAAGVHTAVDDGGSAVLRHPVSGALISRAPRRLRECNDALSAGSAAEAERMPTLAGDSAISWE